MSSLAVKFSCHDRTILLTIGHDIEEAEAMVHQDGGPCRCRNCMEMSMAHSARIMERSTHTDFELSDNVVKIETDDGCKIYVVGTAHFSTASQEDVSQVKCFCFLLSAIRLFFL